MKCCCSNKDCRFFETLVELISIRLLSLRRDIDERRKPWSSIVEEFGKIYAVLEFVVNAYETVTVRELIASLQKEEKILSEGGDNNAQSTA